MLYEDNALPLHLSREYRFKPGAAAWPRPPGHACSAAHWLSHPIIIYSMCWQKTLACNVSPFPETVQCVHLSVLYIFVPLVIPGALGEAARDSEALLPLVQSWHS